jgi:hypothetical protein
MRKSRFSEEQIAYTVRQAEAGALVKDRSASAARQRPFLADTRRVLIAILAEDATAATTIRLATASHTRWRCRLPGRSSC